MDIQEKEWGSFVEYLKTKGVIKIGRNALGVITNLVREGSCTLGYNDLELMWETWRDAKAQAVPEQDQQVWATSNLTWKDIAFRALSCKVLKSTENWVHVKNIAGVGSTTASLICKKLGVDPNGTKFDLIEAQEPANET